MAAPKKRREAERELKKLGFEALPKRGKGSHEVWQNSEGVSITVPNHGDEIAAGTWRSIERTATKAHADAKAKAEAAEAQRIAGQGVAKAGGQSRGSNQAGRSTGRHDSGKKRGWGRGS
jgi:predicted RNA binding protein YcfA (HicA-like mRNA interferase family)